MEKNHNNEHEVILLEHIGKQLKSYFLPNDLSGLCWEQSFNSFITVIKKLVIISGLLHVLCAMTHSFFESHNPVYFLSTPFLSRPPFLKYSPIKDQLHLCSCNPLSLCKPYLFNSTFLFSFNLKLKEKKWLILDMLIVT